MSPRAALVLLAVPCAGVDWSRFADACAWIGDVDGDGQADLAVSDCTYSGGADAGSGIVTLLSGEDGNLVQVVRRKPGDVWFGRRLASLGVGEATGEPVLAVSLWRKEAPGPLTGLVRILSVQSGDVVAELQAPDGEATFGALLAAGRDVDGDGVLDYAVGAPGGNSAGGLGTHGRCYVFSGEEHELLECLEAGGEGVAGCAALALVGDMDGDGLADVALGNPGLLEHRENLSNVELWSPASGQRIRTLCEPKPLRLFGRAIADVGDVDGDGRDDLAVGAPAGTSHARWNNYPRSMGEHAQRRWQPSRSARPFGAVYLFSGSDGAALGMMENQDTLRRGSSGFVGDAFGEDLALARPENGPAAVLLVTDYASSGWGAVHAFGLPGTKHLWSLHGEPRDLVDGQLGYVAPCGGPKRGTPFLIGSGSPYGGYDPDIRWVRAQDGRQRLSVRSSEVLPCIE